jgi:5-methylcytosine-specific restriction endonuclease McrA
MARKEFSKQSILKRLVETPAKCKKCGKTALQGKLNLHHANGDSSDNDWTNIIIFCDGCHNDKYDTIPKHRDEPKTS